MKDIYKPLTSLQLVNADQRIALLVEEVNEATKTADEAIKADKALNKQDN